MVSTQIDAVIWDFGGVITSSPFEAFNRYESENGIPLDFIRRVNATNPETNAWALFERSEVSLDEFDRLFAEEAAALGHEIPGSTVIAMLYGDIRPEMVTALTRCAEHFKTGCITNNVKPADGGDFWSQSERTRSSAAIMGIFDHVIESSKIGIRKPDPRIYRMMCEALGVDPARCVYLDDLGINLKPAREMGMHTIKVVKPEPAIAELEAVTGLDLR